MRSLLLLLLACGGKDDDSATQTTPPTGTTSPSADRYDPTHLTTVAATLDPTVWDVLLHESRLFIDVVLGPDCFTGPIPNVFDWHPGEVTIDGETLSNVGFRKKGFIGSLSWTRPSLKVDTDRFEAGQTFADGTEHFTFNNNNQDVSRVHTCLAYKVFHDAGLAAPLCSFATVEVNGEDLGVYSNVEPIKNDFLRRNFGEADGQLYEGTASDFNDAFLPTFDVKTDGADRVPLQELADALTLPDDQLIAELESLMDLDAFITFWVVEGLIGHWDGYTQAANNFYVYHDAQGELSFLPWGADAVFEDPASDPLFTGGLLAVRLWNHPVGKQRWLDEAERVLSEVWDEDALHSEVDRMQALIEPHLIDPTATSAAVDTVHRFIDSRRATVEATLAAPPVRPMFDKPAVCIDPIGDVSLTFDTVWDSHSGDPFTYATTLTGTIHGVPLDTTYLGSSVGYDENGTRMLQILALDAAADFVTQIAVEFPEDLSVGSYAVDIAVVPGYIVQGSLATEQFELVGFLGGELTLDEAGYVAGNPVSGSLDAVLIPNVFE